MRKIKETNVIGNDKRRELLQIEWQGNLWRGRKCGEWSTFLT